MYKSTLPVAATVAIVWAFSSAPAYAYIDPGTGSMILQGLIGAVAGGLFLMRTWWTRIVAMVSGARKSADAAAPTDTNAQ
jgi:hypothetical protein